MIRLLFIFLAVSHSAVAQGLILPPADAEETSSALQPLDAYHLPVRAFDRSNAMTEPAEGKVITRTFRVKGEGRNTLAILQSFRRQIVANAYEVLLDCDQISCGGFDFRFGMRVTPAPAMEVDLTDFRFLSAQKPVTAGKMSVAVLVSRAADAAYIELVEVLPADAPDIEPAAEQSEAVPDSEIGAVLARIGRVSLDGLEFESGKAELAADPKNILADVAKWLAENPDATLILVGHTDNEGTLESNIAVSRRRAEAVRSALVSLHGVSAARLDVDGVGFLVPRAANDTVEGRTANRRVEAVVR